MDYRERSYRYLFWRQLFISLTAIGLVYILFIRPVQSFAVREFILPAFDSFIKPDSDIVATPGENEFPLITVVRKFILFSFDSFIKPDCFIVTKQPDEFFLTSITSSFPIVKLEMPFNGYFWLAIAMIWPTKNKRFSSVIWRYNWALFLIIPMVAIGIINGFTWLAPLTNVHEKVYKALFLILGILAVRETDELLKD